MKMAECDENYGSFIERHILASPLLTFAVCDIRCQKAQVKERDNVNDESITLLHMETAVHLNG